MNEASRAHLGGSLARMLAYTVLMSMVDMQWRVGVFVLRYFCSILSTHSKTLSARAVKRVLNVADDEALALVLEHGSIEAAIDAGLKLEAQKSGCLQQSVETRFTTLKGALSVGGNQ